MGDRFARSRVMVVADVIRFGALLALGFWSSRLAIGEIAPLTKVLSIGSALFRPAYSAVVPSLVPRDSLQSVNALVMISISVASILGPGRATATIKLKFM